MQAGQRDFEFLGTLSAAGGRVRHIYPTGVSGVCPNGYVDIVATIACPGGPAQTPVNATIYESFSFTNRYRNRLEVAPRHFVVDKTARVLIVDAIRQSGKAYPLPTYPSIAGGASADVTFRVPLQYANLLSPTKDGAVDVRELHDLEVVIPSGISFGGTLTVSGWAISGVYFVEPGGVFAARRTIEVYATETATPFISYSGMKIQYVAGYFDAGDDAKRISTVTLDGKRLLHEKVPIGRLKASPIVDKFGAAGTYLSGAATGYAMIQGAVIGDGYSHREGCRRVAIVYGTTPAVKPEFVVGLIEPSTLENTGRATGEEIQAANDRLIVKGQAITPQRQLDTELPDDTAEFIPRWRAA